MRFGFVTCVQLGLACMEAIYEVGGELSLAFTLNDDLAVNKSGRVWIDDFCLEHDLPLIKIRHINDGELAEVTRREKIDWLFVIGWSQIACSDVLDAPIKGVLGMHPTLLPVGRGRASIPWAILKGLCQTGVTLFKLDEGVDTGEIVAQHIVSIEVDETATRLYDRIIAAHILLMRSIWPKLVDGSVRLTQQIEENATVWPGRTPADGMILESMTLVAIDRLVRAVTHPYPGAFWDCAGERIVVWSGSISEVKGAIPIPAIDGTYWATHFSRMDIFS